MISPPNAIEGIKTQWLPKVELLTTFGYGRLLVRSGVLGRHVTTSNRAATLGRLLVLGHILTSFLFDIGRMCVICYATGSA